MTEAPTTPPVGRHGLFTLHGVDPAILEKVASVKKRLWAIAQDCRLTVVAESGHQFQPTGATYVLVLAESHMSIHTYPEYSRAYVDLFTCNLGFDMNDAVAALNAHFAPTSIDWTATVR
jgi:S-adenosylmethionine decarboxylase